MTRMRILSVEMNRPEPTNTKPGSDGWITSGHVSFVVGTGPQTQTLKIPYTDASSPAHASQQAIAQLADIGDAIVRNIESLKVKANSW